MRVWFDILTPKQVMFFKPAVEQLEKDGNEILCTSRRYREAVELARIKKLEIRIIGRHGGADKYEKLRASANRVFELSRVINQFQPDIAITFSSPEGARVAFGLGIRHFGFSDSPHAEAVSKLTVPLMNLLFCPWVIPYNAWYKWGISRKYIIRYRGLDPVAWIKRIPSQLRQRKMSVKLSGENNISKIIDGYVEPQKKTVLIRPEESKASYIADKRIVSSLDKIDNIVNRLSSSTNIIILCRYEDQLSELIDRYGRKAHVVGKVTDAIPLIIQADLFIGAGGTMTAEAALLGKPTISIAPVTFYIEEYLVRSGLIKKPGNSGELVKLAQKMIFDKKYAHTQTIRAKHILDTMEDPIPKLLSFLKKDQHCNT